MNVLHQLLSRFGPLCPRYEREEARQNAFEWWCEAKRLERELAVVMDWNACFALENSELRFQLDEIRGDA